MEVEVGVEEPYHVPRMVQVQVAVATETTETAEAMEEKKAGEIVLVSGQHAHW